SPASAQTRRQGDRMQGLEEALGTVRSGQQPAKGHTAVPKETADTTATLRDLVQGTMAPLEARLAILESAPLPTREPATAPMPSPSPLPPATAAQNPDPSQSQVATVRKTEPRNSPSFREEPDWRWMLYSLVAALGGILLLARIRRQRQASALRRQIFGDPEANRPPLVMDRGMGAGSRTSAAPGLSLESNGRAERVPPRLRGRKIFGKAELIR
ncbi:MAG: hypothetical protein HQL82_17310, partial [Magnetococcales bacterium]|nr:hypothetical protein [Magnetococcales bacterium]